MYINCKFFSKKHPVCKLGMYGGMPSYEICELCVLKKQNNEEFALSTIKSKPLLVDQASSALVAVKEFASSGFKTTPPDILDKRKDICRECSEWDSEALNKTGRCRKCGCSTWAKLRMATERCPIGKWESCVS